MVEVLASERPDMDRTNVGVSDGPRWQQRVAALAVVLTLVMTYSMVLVFRGASWHVAVVVPVLLAGSAVQLVRHAFTPGRPGVARLASLALQDAALVEGGRSHSPAGKQLG